MSETYKIVRKAVPEVAINNFLEYAKGLPFNSKRSEMRHTDDLNGSVHRLVRHYLRQYAREISVDIFKVDYETVCSSAPIEDTSHVLHYEASECDPWHVDYSTELSQKVGASLALNSSGHLFQVVTCHGVKTFIQEAGDLVLYPGWATHRLGSPLELGLSGQVNERWSFAMWLHGPDFK